MFYRRVFCEMATTIKHGSLLKALLFIAFCGVTKQRFSDISREVKQPSPEFLFLSSSVLSILFLTTVLV